MPSELPPATAATVATSASVAAGAASTASAEEVNGDERPGAKVPDASDGDGDEEEEEEDEDAEWAPEPHDPFSRYMAEAEMEAAQTEVYAPTGEHKEVRSGFAGEERGSK